MTHVLPNWECLKILSRQAFADKSFWNTVDQIKQSPPKRRLWLAQQFVRFILRDPAFKKFAALSWCQIIDIIADQAARNKSLLNDHPVWDDLKPIGYNRLGTLVRPFSQLPCTRMTAQKRVQLLSQWVKKNDPILFMGDDDFVSVVCYQHGFTNVTVLDIDQRVLDGIRNCLPADQQHVRLFKHDFTKPVQEKAFMDQVYRVVVLDPPYSVAGIKTFLCAALDMASSSSQLDILLNVHLYSLLPQGIKELQEILKTYHLRLMEFYPGFNAYPVPYFIQLWLVLVNLFVIGRMDLGVQKFSLPFFFSDAHHLKRTGN